jgi:hypothetical protein
MKFIIESNVPLPPKKTRAGVASPFLTAIAGLGVGDSFDIGVSKPRVVSSHIARAHQFAKARGVKLSWRGTRVWRIA